MLLQQQVDSLCVSLGSTVDVKIMNEDHLLLAISRYRFDLSVSQASL